MATTKYIQGLSRSGFRVGTTRVKYGSSVAVDLDDRATQLLLVGEKENFIRTKASGTCTVTSATPAVVSENGHGFVADDCVVFSSTLTVPTGLTAGVRYFVIAAGLTANAFEVSATRAGAAINTTDTGTGTITVTPASVDIVGIDRRGFRIQDVTGAWTVIKVGAGVKKVDLTVGNTLRTLRRSYGRYVYGLSASNLSIRGVSDKQNSFDTNRNILGVDVLTSDNTNVANGDTVVIGADTYTFKTALTEAFATDTVTSSGVIASVRASGTVTTSGTGAANNDTVTIGSVTYTFKTALTGAANEVVRTGVEDVDLTNLKAAINAEAGIGSTYGTGTVANPNVTCGAVIAHVVIVTAVTYKAVTGNAFPLSKTGAVLTVSGAGTLTSGTNETVNVNGHTYTFVEVLDTGVADEILINGQDISLDNLRSAINGTAGAGSTYGTGTVTNTDVTCGARSLHTITLTAKALGTTANAFTLAVVGTHLSRATANFTGGLNSIAREVLVDGGGVADTSLTHLVEAINGGANKGTDYSTATVASLIVIASVVGSHATTLTAIKYDADTTAISTTAAHLSLSTVDLEEGHDVVYRGTTSHVDTSVPFNFRALKRHFRDYIEAD